MRSRSRRTSRMSPPFLILFAFLGVFFLVDPCAVEADIGHRSAPLKDFRFDFNRRPFPFHAEVNARLQELARKQPEIARTMAIGKPREGRKMMVMGITDQETCPGTSKPALWLDGNSRAEAGLYPHPARGTG